MIYTVVSVEDGIACLEASDSANVLVKSDLLPQSIKEGDILCYDGNKYRINSEATAERRKEIHQKYTFLFNNRSE